MALTASSGISTMFAPMRANLPPPADRFDEFVACTPPHILRNQIDGILERGISHDSGLNMTSPYSPKSPYTNMMYRNTPASKAKDPSDADSFEQLVRSRAYSLPPAARLFPIIEEDESQSQSQPTRVGRPRAVTIFERRA